MKTRPTLEITAIAERIAAHEPTAVPLADAPRRTAVSIVLRDTNGAVEVLYIRRVEHPDDPWSGHIAFPGGHVDGEDFDVVATAVREAREEVGVDLERDARLLGRLDDVRGRAQGRILPLAISPVVFALERDVTLLPDPTEVAAAFWLPLTPLATGEHASTYLYRRAEIGEVALPCWRIEGHCIWGLTFLMTCELLAVLGHRVVLAPPQPSEARAQGSPG